MRLDDFIAPGPGFRSTDPVTSAEAARGNPAQRRLDQITVLSIHARHPAGLTDFELADIMRRQQTSVGKRRGELRDAGLIEATELRRFAPSGSLAIVWKITEAGKAEAQRSDL